MKLLTRLPIFLFIAILAGCSSNKIDQEADYSSADSVGTARSDNETSAESKLVKTASMNFKVRDVYKSSLIISEKARNAGGMIMHQNIEATENNSKTVKLSDDSVLVISSYTTRADITARVPSIHLEEFMNEVGSVSSFVSNSKLDIDDKSIDYLSNQLKQQSREKLLNTAEAKTKKSKEVTDLISKSDELIDQQASNQRINNDVKYSTVELSFYQNQLIRKEMVANSDLSPYRQPLLNQFTDAISGGWIFFLEVLITLSRMWAFLLLILVAWLGYRYFKSKGKFAPFHSKQ